MAYHGLISGYCPSLTPLNYAEVGTALSADAPRALDTIPYTCAMFVIQLEEIGSAEPFATADMMWGDSDPAGYGVAAMLTGTIREVVFLQDGYPDPTGRTVRISLRLESDAQLQSLSLEQGQNYLIYGTDYQDLDWQLRCKIANGDAELFSEVDWSHIRMLSEEEIQQLDQESFQISGAETPYRAVYEGGLYLTQEDLDWVDCSSLTICTNPLYTSVSWARRKFCFPTAIPCKQSPPRTISCAMGRPALRPSPARLLHFTDYKRRGVASGPGLPTDQPSCIPCGGNAKPAGNGAICH